MNQNPEQKARDIIDSMLEKSGWIIQSKNEINLNLSTGIAVREYPTSAGIADYILFVNGKPCGIVEAKRPEEGERMTVHEDQAKFYAHSKLKYLNNDSLPFVYESTGKITKFTNYIDPAPRSREIFSFHRPETLSEWNKDENTIRSRLLKIPELNKKGLRDAQINAIYNLEKSLEENRPKALIQMATGSGKTFTACTFTYRLLKYAKAKRILFLVDTKNLGEQAEQEFINFQPNDSNRKFTELYNVQRLASNYIASDSQVCISTIQRIYSILKGEELDETSEENNPNELSLEKIKKEPMPVEYSPENPIEQFDFIIIDECHRSIYNLWKQVLDYYDAFLVGLTATPDKRTFAFFNENVVSEYTFDQSVIDGVNVPYDVFLIETEITKKGAEIKKKPKLFVETREKLTRKKRWELLDEDFKYEANALDKAVVNPSQIRNIIKNFKEQLPQIFPDRKDINGIFEVPKTLVFAKTDSHADDIINTIREEFGEGNEFCKKLTYKITEDPKSVLSNFRNSWNPRIAVTVDMIATGTDVKPLEILLFMRDVKSVNYFEQMKGRGVRTIKFDDLKRVTRTVKSTKTHFVIFDAIGAFKSKKTDSRPLEKKPSVSMKELLNAVAVGAKEEGLFTSLGNRLIRLEKQINPKEKEKIKELTGGKDIKTIARDLLNAYNPDLIEEKSNKLIEQIPEREITPAKIEECKKQVQNELQQNAAKVFNGKLNNYIENVRRLHNQIIDNINIDKVTKSEWDKTSKENAKQLVNDFEEYIKDNKDEITALSIFYDQPYRRRELSVNIIEELYQKLIADKPLLSPFHLWEAYSHIEDVKYKTPKNHLVALVSLVRKAIGIDKELTAYDKTVDKNFQDWVFRKQAGTLKFTKEQMEWLRKIKDHFVMSFSFDSDDLEYTPFDALGGKGKMWQLFGNDMNNIIDELNEALAA